MVSQRYAKCLRRTPLARAIAATLALLPLVAAFPLPVEARDQASARESQAKRGRLISFNIPVMPLGEALQEWSEQARTQFQSYDADLEGKVSRPVVGAYSEQAALQLLLQNTGLTYKVGGRPRLYSVMREPPAPRSTARGSQERTHGASRSADPGQPEIVNLGDETVERNRAFKWQRSVGAPRWVIDREDIERSGFATVADLAKSIPQNFEGGATEDTILGREAETNASSGTALNLRGLGAGSTVTLVNGRRLAPGGSEGTFTDISTIPRGAVERVDIVADGASTFHGPDAVGGIVNFILSPGYDGAQTQMQTGFAPDGGATEALFGQSIGSSWTSGSALLVGEHYERDSLRASDRDFTASSNLTRFGGNNFDSPQSNPGNVRVGNQIFAIPPGQDGSALTPGDFTPGTINLRNRNAGNDMLPQQERDSFFGTWSQELGASTILFAEGLYSRRDSRSSRGGFAASLPVPETNAFYVNPTGGTGTVRVDYDFTRDIGARVINTSQEVYNTALGATMTLGEEWNLSFELGAAGEELGQRTDNLVSPLALATALADFDRTTAFNAFGDGSHTNPATLAGLRASAHFAMDSDLDTVGLTAEGVLLRMGSREVRLALGAEARRYELDSVTRAEAPGFPTTRNSYERDVTSVFAELLIPLVDAPDDQVCCGRLDLSVGARNEHYSDAGSRLSPKLGLEWSPLSGITLGGTWSNSHKAPNLIDLDETNNGSIIFLVPDPQSPTGVSPVLLWFGKNQELREETAATWTVGTTIAPPALPGTRIAVTYFDIEFADRIRELPPEVTFLTDPTFADIVTRDPSGALRDEVCNRTFFFGLPDDCRNAPVVALVDGRDRNTAITRTRGVDLLASHEIPSPFGTFTTALNATWLLAFEEAWARNAPTVSMLDTQHNPLRLRARGSLGWELGGASAAVQVRHTGSYRDTASEPDRKVDAWTTLDLRLGYEVAADYPGLLAGMSFSVNLQNALDDDPPFLNNPRGIAYDEENANPQGRFLSLQVLKNW